MLSLVSAALAMVYMNASATEVQSRPFEPFKGKPAPTLTIENAQGEAVPLTSFKGKVVLLNLWATWCPPCVRELPFLQQLNQQYEKQGLVIIALSEDRGGLATVVPYYEKQRITLPIYIDKDTTIYRAMEVRGLPTTYVLNRKGEFVAKMEGDTDWMSQESRLYIESLLNVPYSASGKNPND